MAGPFELVRLLGSGATAHVFEGVHQQLGFRAAVKVLSEHQHHRVDLLRREMEAVARLNHVHIVELFDFGLLGEGGELDGVTLKAGAACITMEFLDGGSVRFEAQRSWRAVADLCLQVLDALAHAHARGVLHRDIKPGNLLLTRAEAQQVKLTDFGVSRVFRTYEETQKHFVSGTPRFMAPEQLTGEWRDEGAWTDLYALGCLAFYLLEGRSPFPSSSLLELLGEKVSSPLRPTAAHIPEPFARWVEKMTAPFREDRFQRAADAAHALNVLFSASADEAPSRQLARAQAPRSSDDIPTIVLSLVSAQASLLEVAHVTSLRAEPLATSDRDEPPMKSLVEHAAGGFPWPPIPSEWRRPLTHSLQVQRGTGMGVLGWRASPMIAREQERGRLWTLLRQAFTERRAGCVVIEGEAGSGKTRLASWLGERAEELGAATLLSAFHGPVNGDMHGLEAMFRRHFKLQGLNRAETFTRLQKLWRCLEGEHKHVHSCSTMASLLCHVAEEADGDDVTPVTVSSLHERYVSIAALLKLMCRERPVIFWIDDLQWGADALRAAEHLLKSLVEEPILVVATCRSDLLPSRKLESSVFQRMTESCEVHRMQIGPLASGDVSELLLSLVGLSPELTESLVERAAGSPLMALQLLTLVIENKQLVVTEDGVVLKDAARLPTTPWELWGLRLRQAVGAMEPSTRQDCWRALELAATLGERVLEQEWAVVCQLGALSPASGLLPQLAVAGLIRRERGMWSFTHGQIPETLVEMSRQGGRAVSHNRLCADALAGPLWGEERRRRYIDHLVAAERLEDALEPLLVLTRRLIAIGDYPQGRLTLDERDLLLDRVGVARDSLLRGKALNLRGSIFNEEGKLAEADAAFKHALVIAQKHNSVRDAGQALCGRAFVQLSRGHLDAARTLVEQVTLVLDGLECEELAMSHRVNAWIHGSRGRFDEALKLLERAAALKDHMLHNDHTKLLYDAAAIAFFSGDLLLTMDKLESSRDLILASGMRTTTASWHNLRGEVARILGDLDLAEASYRRALSIYNATGNLNRFIAEENLGRVSIARGQHLEALHRFSRLVNRRDLIPPVRRRALAALVLCTIHLEEWRALDQVLTLLEDDWNSEISVLDTDLLEDLKVALDHLRGTPRVASVQRIEALMARRSDEP